MKIIIDNNSINIFTNKEIKLSNKNNKYNDLELMSKNKLIDILEIMINHLKWLTH